MIAMVVSGLVAATIYAAYTSQQRTAINQEQVVEMQQNIRAGLDVMIKEIRMAGYSGPNGCTPPATITLANATQLTFTMLVEDEDDPLDIDNDNDGTPDEGDEVETFSYSLYDAYGDGDLDLGRRHKALLQAVAENIDAIEFNYTMVDGTQTTTPGTLDDIRVVQVSILARASQADREFTNSITYTPGSGNAAWDINGATVGTGNPPNDNFRRRLLITTVQCRNMGL
jgi:type IV pilus assembly protein PilW